MDKKYEIKKISNVDEKKQAEPFLRALWKQCFDDPKAYEDFYFTNVYPANTVYFINEKGMLHLNPYPCYVNGENLLLHYIVGVATDQKERRKGVMTSLLESALMDMNEQGEPFTYLMPADEWYYKPFDFVSITRKKETFGYEHKLSADLNCGFQGDEEKTNIDLNQMKFLSYEDLSKEFTLEEQDLLFDSINKRIAKKHLVFAKHDRAYFNLLMKEKACQDGKIVFCFHADFKVDCCIGFFAYAMEDNGLFVDQYFMERDFIQDCILRYHNDFKTIVHQFAYMVRITEVEKFLNLSSKHFEKYVKDHKRLCIVDPIIPANNGVFTFAMEEGRIKATREDSMQNQYDVKMTIEELAEFVFSCHVDQENRVFFAEIV